MKILQVSVVIYLYINYVSSFRLNRIDNGFKLGGLVDKSNSDYVHLTSPHRKRYSGIGPRHIIKEANDLLDSYFRIGSLPVENNNMIESSVSWSEPVENEITRHTVKPITVNAKQIRKPQVEHMEHLPLAPVSEPEVSQQGVVVEKIAPSINIEMEPLPVKRPIIVVGKMRGAGSFQEWRRRRKLSNMGHSVFSMCNHNIINDF